MAEATEGDEIDLRNIEKAYDTLTGLCEEEEDLNSCFSDSESFHSCCSTDGSYCSFYSLENDMCKDGNDKELEDRTDIPDDCSQSNFNETRKTDGKFSLVQVDSLETKTDLCHVNNQQHLAHEESMKFFMNCWSDSNLSSSGSSLAETSFDSDGTCTTTSRCMRKRPLLRRSTMTTLNRKPWNYAAGSPCLKLQNSWSTSRKASMI